jgi:glycogen debranching enzyme
MLKGDYALEQLWDPLSSQYYSRNFVTHELIKEPSIATLLPLYSGIIKKERAAVLVRMLEKDRLFGPAYPVPSVPLESAYFNPKRYWQGPTWMNINWLIIDGLRRYGFHDHADALKESSLEMMSKSGIAEYYDPLTGDPLGADNFSWTAALAIDLLKTP